MERPEAELGDCISVVHGEAQGFVKGLPCSKGTATLARERVLARGRGSALQLSDIFIRQPGALDN